MNRSVFITIVSVFILGGLWLYSIQFPVDSGITNFEECVKAGNPVMESYPRKCKNSKGETFIENIGNILEKANLIQADIKPNQEIKSPLIITGKARGFWFFEADFQIELLDASGSRITTAIAKAGTDWMTEEFVFFKAILEFQATDTKGTLIFKKNNPSGLSQNDDSLIIPVKIKQSDSQTRVNVYFSNSRLNPETICEKVHPVKREISKTQAVGKAALEELLKGPTDDEKNSGFATNINSEVKLQKLIIENGVAKADFNERLGFQIGGSCKVLAIRAQIEETLKQFPTVDNVIISINGNSEDILQP